MKLRDRKQGNGYSAMEELKRTGDSEATQILATGRSHFKLRWKDTGGNGIYRPAAGARGGSGKHGGRVLEKHRAKEEK